MGHPWELGSRVSLRWGYRGRVFGGQGSRGRVSGAGLQQAPGPGDDGQGDPSPQLLQQSDQRRVGHPPRVLTCRLQQDVPTPAHTHTCTHTYTHTYTHALG